MELIIPGLPDDLAKECLCRLPFSQIHRLRSVCKTWNSNINLSDLFRLRRKYAYKATPLLILHPLYYSLYPEKHRRLLVFDPETGFSSDMPPLPDSNQLPIDCRTAVVGSKLVVIGGYDDQTKTRLDSVFVFDFYSSTWSHGAKIPDGPRKEFACDTYDNRTVFVAGGFSSTWSAWTYDVVSNNWSQLPDMIKDADMEHKTYKCTGLFYHDKLEVFIIKEGHANLKIEIFDISTRKWSWEHFPLSRSYCHRSKVQGSDQNLYQTGGDDLMVLKDGIWKSITTLPAKDKPYEYGSRYLIASPGHLWFIYASKCREPYDCFKMDLKDHSWIKSKVPIKLYLEIDSGCSLII